MQLSAGLPTFEMLNNLSFFRLLTLASLVAFAIVSVACAPKTANVALPVDASSQTDDLELREFIAALYKDAVQNADSALHRGRLAMAYDANGFAEASIQSYEQVSQLDETDMRWPYL